MDVLLVPCSIRPGGLSPRVGLVLAAELEALGASVARFDLATLPLHGTFNPLEGFPPAVQAWRDSIAASSLITWVTPTYHSGLPGVAKNALDLLDVRVMGGRRNAICGASTLNAEAGAHQLAQFVRYIGGVLPFPDLVIPNLRTAWPKDVAECPPEVLERVAAWARVLAGG